MFYTAVQNALVLDARVNVVLLLVYYLVLFSDQKNKNLLGCFYIKQTMNLLHFCNGEQGSPKVFFKTVGHSGPNLLFVWPKHTKLNKFFGMFFTWCLSWF